MTTLTSTVPGCIAALQTHFATVASNNASLNLGVYTGLPIEEATNNFLMIGNVDSGELIEGYRQDWRGFPASAERKSEEYGVPCSIRAWSGESVAASSPTNRVADAFTIMDAVLGQLQADPQATVNGSYALTASGSWQVTSIEIPVSGPLGGQGWGVLMTFTVSVINVYLTS